MTLIPELDLYRRLVAPPAAPCLPRRLPESDALAGRGRDGNAGGVRRSAPSPPAMSDMTGAGCGPAAPDGPLRVEDLEHLVRAGLSSERRWWPASRHHDLGLTIAAAAFEVTGLTPGLYLAPPLGKSPFVRLAGPEWLPWLHHRCPVAPITLLVCGDLERAEQAMGQHGYGQLLVRSSMIAYAVRDAGISMGLTVRLSQTANRHANAALSCIPTGPLNHLLTMALYGDTGRGTR
jgi:hypothetical protein